ncbi:sugar phosphate isomerase/epimerase family protein [Humibacillus xanthopallidus]|uniref:sugar phosphate isomerase/epimerase family protein n=1 Tax=Humibacillus xanthopallidus TaxID=412689 RepID=UPI0021AB1986|nr:sugar phosphate isomerase/epimerase [Humibacillus xanthopallidus]
MERVIEVATAAGLGCIEWGADVHAPPDDLARLDEVRLRTEDAGLRVASYGSYWRAGVDVTAQARRVIEATQRLGTHRVRVWAGAVASADADPTTRERVIAAAREAADIAAGHGVSLSFEFHADTLTDSAQSTLDLLREVDHPSVSTYWQPPNDVSDAAALHTLRQVLDKVSAVHVFSWWPATHRLPLVGRRDMWRAALQVLATRTPVDLLLEFVVDDDPDLVASEARALRALTDGSTQ